LAFSQLFGSGVWKLSSWWDWAQRTRYSSLSLSVLSGSLLTLWVKIIRSLVFCFVQYYVRDIITMPVALYSTFVIEQRFGFNKQTLLGFFLDHVKVTALIILFGGPILSGLVLVIQWGGEFFWFCRECHFLPFLHPN
jgi:hypothetical protein